MSNSPRTEVTPLDIKAEGVALLAMGYSTREVERRLKAKFPGAKVPKYNTVARWTRSAEKVRTGKRVSDLRWLMIFNYASSLLVERIDELGNLSDSQLVKAWARIDDIVRESEVRRQRLR